MESENLLSKFPTAKHFCQETMRVISFLIIFSQRLLKDPVDNLTEAIIPPPFHNFITQDAILNLIAVQVSQEPHRYVALHDLTFLL